MKECSTYSGKLRREFEPWKGARLQSASGLDGLYFGYAWVHVESSAAKLEFRRIEAAKPDQSGWGKRMR